KAVKPHGPRVCRARVDKDCVTGTGVVCSAITLYHLDLLEVSKILARTRGEVSVHLDADDLTSRPNDFSNDRRVVTDATPHMEYAISFPKVEGIKTVGKKTRLPVIQPAICVNCNEYVVVEVRRVIILGHPVGAVFNSRTQNLPRPGAKKVLALNF